MKIVHVEHQGDFYLGELLPADQLVMALGKLGDDLPSEMSQVIAQWDTFDFRQRSSKNISFALGDVSLQPPVVGSQKIFCVGRNYAEHAAEMGSAVGELPVIFNKLPSCIIGPNQPIRLPLISEQVDYEAELVVVIGRGGKHLPQSQAMSHVFGFCCGNDVSARDWQKGKPGGQWLLGKSFDSFAPIGPWIVTAGELAIEHLDIQLRLNGQTMQHANTSQMIFNVAFLVSHLSQFCTLAPGDLLFTGTPQGVGAGRQPPVFLQDGDRVEVEIEGLGILENPVIREATSTPRGQTVPAN